MLVWLTHRIMYISVCMHISFKYRVDTVFYLMSPLLYLLYVEGILIKKEEMTSGLEATDYMWLLLMVS